MHLEGGSGVRRFYARGLALTVSPREPPARPAVRADRRGLRLRLEHSRCYKRPAERPFGPRVWNTTWFQTTAELPSWPRNGPMRLRRSDRNIGMFQMPVKWREIVGEGAAGMVDTMPTRETRRTGQHDRARTLIRRARATSSVPPDWRSVRAPAKLLLSLASPTRSSSGSSAGSRHMSTSRFSRGLAAVARAMSSACGIHPIGAPVRDKLPISRSLPGSRRDSARASAGRRKCRSRSDADLRSADGMARGRGIQRHRRSRDPTPRRPGHRASATRQAARPGGDPRDPARRRHTPQPERRCATSRSSASSSPSELARASRRSGVVRIPAGTACS